MIGPLALHGGAEFGAGDETFLGELLRTASASAAAAGREPPDPLRIALVPTAAANHRPALAAANGVAAFERLAPELGIALRAREVRVVDQASAADTTLADRLAAADLVYLPGGDPGVVLDVLSGSRALEALVAARLRGAVVAGASAGAMAFGEWAWTPGGMRRGLGWAGRLVVSPHASPERVAGAAAERQRLIGHDRIGLLLLDERTGVIDASPGEWRVAGTGSAHWLAPHAGAAVSVAAGGTIRA